ncbi:MAG: flagellar basal body-associated protein FliL [Pontimonas sp.]|jgi:flagellar basal body-associated protein FliL
MVNPEDSQSFFDLFTGLPLHPLIIHIVIVMLPLAALAMIVVMVFPRLRKPYLPVALGASVIATASAYVAAQSGKALQERVGWPGVHAELGDIVFPLTALFTLASIVWAVISRPKKPAAVWITHVVAVAVVSLAVAAITFLVLAGHSGAKAAWEDRIAPQVSSSEESLMVPGG